MTHLAAAYPGELRRLSALYCWDADPRQAAAHEARVILRTMNLGVWEDVLAVERIVGATDLARILRESPPGALTPRAWSFWHHRLGLVPPGEDPPPRPARWVR